MHSDPHIVVMYDSYDEGTQRRCAWVIEDIAQKYSGKLQSVAFRIDGGELIFSFNTQTNGYWFITETAKYLRTMNVVGKAWTLRN